MKTSNTLFLSLIICFFCFSQTLTAQTLGRRPARQSKESKESKEAVRSDDPFADFEAEESATVKLARELMERASLTPEDAGCADLLRSRLEPLHFQVEVLKFGDVTNLWATYGEEGPLLVFAGHTDVVPPGPAEGWMHPPFSPTIEGDKLYGRGAADMKGAIAAMTVAAETFVRTNPNFKGRVGFLITSNEEGTGVSGNKTDGTKRVMEYLAKRGEKIDYAVVGEPSSEVKFGDTIRHGRRGSFNGQLKIHGKQGHVAYPDKAENPIHQAMRALDELVHTKWDDGNANFRPTTLQISNIKAGTGAGNVIPDQLECSFNLRYSTSITPDQIKAKIHRILDRYGLKYEITWQESGKPFLTTNSRLVPLMEEAVKEVTRIRPRCTTDGGTSDARYIAPYGVDVLEFGLKNETIHGLNEHVSVKDLDALTNVYFKLLGKVFRSH